MSMSAFILLSALLSLSLAYIEHRWQGYLLAAFFAALGSLLLFSRATALTISVDNDTLTWVLGNATSFLSTSKKIGLASVASADKVSGSVYELQITSSRSPVFYSFRYKANGIRIGGNDYVKITKTDGTIELLGTDDPQGLLSALQVHHIESSPKSDTPEPNPDFSAQIISRVAFVMISIILAVIVFSLIILHNI